MSALYYSAQKMSLLANDRILFSCTKEKLRRAICKL